MITPVSSQHTRPWLFLWLQLRQDAAGLLTLGPGITKDKLMQVRDAADKFKHLAFKKKAYFMLSGLCLLAQGCNGQAFHL